MFYDMLRVMITRYIKSAMLNRALLQRVYEAKLPRFQLQYSSFSRLTPLALPRTVACSLDFLQLTFHEM